MGKASWAVVNPSQGSGNATVNVSSNTHHTGRNVRTTVLTITAANVEAKTVSVTQQGKPAYVDAIDNAAAEKGGQNVTISGKSNAAKLTFTLGTGDLELVLPETYLANSLQTKNGEAILGDPGAMVHYPFSIQLNVPANEDVNPKSRQIIVTNEAGKTDVCLLTLASGDAYLTVAEGDIHLDYLGTPVSVRVESNTSWTIE